MGLKHLSIRPKQKHTKSWNSLAVSLFFSDLEQMLVNNLLTLF